MKKTSHEYYELSKREYKCKRCGKLFKASRWCKPNRFGNRNEFCSITCSKTTIKPRKCLICGKEFLPPMSKQKYCSKVCYWKGKTYIKGEAHFNYKRIEKHCAVCGKIIRVIPFYKDRNKTCSKKCHSKLQSERMRGEGSPFWAGGVYVDTYGRGFTGLLRGEIRERDEYRCQKCFREQDELYDCNGKKYSLIVHHIDYNKMNNNKSNLISLCRSCHAQTNVNRDNWTNYYKERMVV